MKLVSEGMRLGRYEVRSRLGFGGMGEVYLAEDTQLGRHVALKLLPPETAGDPHARARLVREARAAAVLDHPYICSVYEVGEAEGLLFIAMQYVDGETLETRLHRSPLDVYESLSIAAQVADALAEAHSHAILHRDIKPANIMVTRRGEAKVMDFGLAKPTEIDAASGETRTVSVLSTPGSMIGTLPYMSPEQVRGETLDARSDLFSFGIVLYEMLAGRRPFEDSNPAVVASAILTREAAPVARFAPDIPPELERIVAKALKKNPEERYQTSKDFLIDLRALKDEQEFKRRLERSSGDPVVTRDVTPTPAPSFAATPLPTPLHPSSSVSGSKTPARGRSRGLLAAAAVAVLVAVAAGGWHMWRASRIRWAEAQVREILRLADSRRNFEAYDLAVLAERYLPGEPRITGVLPKIADTISVTSDPTGASVYFQRFNPDASGALPKRHLIGQSPIDNVRIARGEYIVSIEKEGFAPAELSVSGAPARHGQLIVTPPPIKLAQRLVPSAAMPARMAFVPGGQYRLVGWERPTDRRVDLHDFFIDKFETSNQEFKEFINAGGYVKREFWPNPMVKDGQPLAWEEAVRLFVDRTGLPGPRDWSSQNFAEGAADHPVTGISWYEAAAYAKFRGKQLPTLFEWEKAARNGIRGAAGVAYMPWGVFFPGDTLTYRANFGGAPLPVTSMAFGMSPFGAYNMAGNVSEWTLNDSSDGFIATGGSFGDPTYTFGQAAGRPGTFSSSKLGFRLVQHGAESTGDQGAARIEVATEIPVYARSSDTDFRRWAQNYEYKKAPLDARIEETVETPEWIRESITFNGAGNARAIAYLYLPRHFTKPFQVLHYVPAGDVNSGLRPLSDSMDDRMTPYVRAGRAIFGVVLSGYMGRLRTDPTPIDPNTVEYVEYVAGRIIDLRRGLDYLESRRDIDKRRIGFMGPSAGAQIGLILAAVEERYRAVVLVGAGLSRRGAPVQPAADAVNFAPHIRMPKLIVQGTYDEDTPLRTAAEPLFKLLSEPKELYKYEGGHVPPIDVLLKATAGWLDQKLGPVKR
ncbi:MAG: protein kinase [Acidobacteria bacterium]|nr:protein kinase [Acidobacteriota bacterium]